MANNWIEDKIKETQEIIDQLDPLGTEEEQKNYRLMIENLKSLQALRSQEQKFIDDTVSLNEKISESKNKRENARLTIKKLQQELDSEERNAKKKWYQKVDPNTVISGAIAGGASLLGVSMIINWEHDNPITLKNALNRVPRIGR